MSNIIHHSQTNGIELKLILLNTHLFKIVNNSKIYIMKIKRLCIFGPKGAIQIRYYYYY